MVGGYPLDEISGALSRCLFIALAFPQRCLRPLDVVPSVPVGHDESPKIFIGHGSGFGASADASLSLLPSVFARVSSSSRSSSAFSWSIACACSAVVGLRFGDIDRSLLVRSSCCL